MQGLLLWWRLQWHQGQWDSPWAGPPGQPSQGFMLLAMQLELITLVPAPLGRESTAGQTLKESCLLLQESTELSSPVEEGEWGLEVFSRLLTNRPWCWVRNTSINSVCSIPCRVALGGDKPLQGWWCGSGLKAYMHTTFLDLQLFQT